MLKPLVFDVVYVSQGPFKDRRSPSSPSRTIRPPNRNNKAPVKAHKAETEDSGAEGDGESSDEEKSISPDAYICMGRGLKEKDKIAIVKMAIDVEQGIGGPDADF